MPPNGTQLPDSRNQAIRKNDTLFCRGILEWRLGHLSTYKWKEIIHLKQYV